QQRGQRPYAHAHHQQRPGPPGPGRGGYRPNGGAAFNSRPPPPRPIGYQPFGGRPPHANGPPRPNAPPGRFGAPGQIGRGPPVPIGMPTLPHAGGHHGQQQGYGGSYDNGSGPSHAPPRHQRQQRGGRR
ncbi:hypothetical protein LPJ56_004987, partial [Coemansia sp. RSA 2599]